MKKVAFGLLVVLLAAITVFPAAAAIPAPAKVILLSGDPDGGSITSQSDTSWVNYDEGTCQAKCRIDTRIPGSASSTTDQVPYPVVSSLYVQAESGGGYSVCFNAKGIDFPQVWQFVDGNWVLVSTTVVDGAICVRGSGDGVFALFGVKTPPSPRNCVECKLQD